MKKSDKKLEKNIVAALTDVCEKDLKRYDGFLWVTHLVSYQQFPESFSIICVFDSDDNVAKVMKVDSGRAIKEAIEQSLSSHNIVIPGVERRMVFDSEQACDREHGGSWDRRFAEFRNARHA